MICLTFDTDYIQDDDMRKFLESFPFPGKGTFFLWKPFLNFDWYSHEVEPHPFFSSFDNASLQLKDFVQGLGIKPKGIRPHSCAYSQKLGVDLAKQNYAYISAVTPLFQTDIKPYAHPWGLWEMPIYYMDNMDFCFSMNWPKANHTAFNQKIILNAINNNSLYIFDFHPMHIILNTRSFYDYQKVRDKVVIERQSPFRYTFSGRGTRTFFEELCSAMGSQNLKSFSCLDALKYKTTNHI